MDRPTDRHTDRQTHLGIKAPSRSLINSNMKKPTFRRHRPTMVRWYIVRMVWWYMLVAWWSGVALPADLST